MKANPNLKKKRVVEDLEEGRSGLKKELSNRGRPRTLMTKGPNLWRVGTRPSCAKASAYGLLGWRWRVLLFLGMPHFGSLKKVMPTFSPRP